MQFQKVTELIIGTKYKVVYKRLTYAATYVSNDGDTKIFENINGFYGDIMPRKCMYQTISENHEYFVPIFQQKRIQSNMEQRAVNIILQNITGDVNFSW